MKLLASLRLLGFAALTGLAACSSPDEPQPTVSPSPTPTPSPLPTPIPSPTPSPMGNSITAYNKTVYELNVRLFTAAGTLKAAEADLPRLKTLGIGIVWLMPINPIGVQKRVGSLGSPYAVKDYLAVNPEFGTLADLKSFVAAAHAQGMYVILDWVANHTSPDNALVTQHPDWYTRDGSGNTVPPVPTWTDVIDLNFDNAGLRSYMIDAMAYWVREVNIDGYRCDAAELVPNDFWQSANAALRQIRPVFMLAEGETPALHTSGFDATYDWTLYTLMKQIAKGQSRATQLGAFFSSDANRYPADAYRLMFTTNHDENAFTGTDAELYGAGAPTFAVLTATAPGIPMIYNGQEAGLNKRLSLFSRDLIPWQDSPNRVLYEHLTKLKLNHPSLAAGTHGGAMRTISTVSNDIFAFMRQGATDTVVVVLNLSGSPQTILLASDAVRGTYVNALTDQPITLNPRPTLSLEPWAALVYVRP